MNHESHVKHERGEEAAHRDGSPYLGCWGRPGGGGFSRRLLIQQRPEYPNEDRLGASFEFTVVRRALFLDRIYRIEEDILAQSRKDRRGKNGMNHETRTTRKGDPGP